MHTIEHIDDYNTTTQRLLDEDRYDVDGIVEDVTNRLLEVVDGEAAAVISFLRIHFRVIRKQMRQGV